ncbi:unnamed protein product [Schistosoma margrebowiei]|uniref:Uncharacterized protein n=1 Tax=Schistosoma margrebowiei TaxID=48269 RepID=A0AA84ZJA1_9TREM|nr:unnamed protein product [Schistosoma margrebowiei]
MKYKKRKLKLLSWEEKLDRQIQFVNVDNTDENYLSADEPTDVIIMKTVTPISSKGVGGLRRLCMSKYFEADSLINIFYYLCQLVVVNVRDLWTYLFGMCDVVSLDEYTEKFTALSGLTGHLMMFILDKIQSYRMQLYYCLV